MQFFDDCLLRLHHRFGRRRLWFQPTRVQAGQDLPARDPGAFLDQHLRDPFAVVEGEIDLAQIDISVQH